MRSSVSRTDLILLDAAALGFISRPMDAAPDACIPSPRDEPFDFTLNFFFWDLCWVGTV